MVLALPPQRQKWFLGQRHKTPRPLGAIKKPLSQAVFLLA